jgi:hypothetical protein
MILGLEESRGVSHPLSYTSLIQNLSNNFSIFYPSQFRSNRNELVFRVAYGKAEVNPPHLQTPLLSSLTPLTRITHYRFVGQFLLNISKM